jgi:hypothetical protein
MGDDCLSASEREVILALAIRDMCPFAEKERLIDPALRIKNKSKTPCPTTATTTDKISAGQAQRKCDQRGAGGLRLVTRGSVSNGGVRTPNARVQANVGTLQLVDESRKTTDDARVVARIIKFKEEWVVEVTQPVPATVVQMEEPEEPFGDYVRRHLGRPDMTDEEVYYWALEKRREYALADKLAEKRNRKLVLLPSLMPLPSASEGFPNPGSPNPEYWMSFFVPF